jgi:uncharacterized protein YjbI with pentapeptide repeats
MPDTHKNEPLQARRSPDPDFLRRLDLHHQWSAARVDPSRKDTGQEFVADGLDLSETDLSGFDLSSVALTNTTFDHANLRRADLYASQLALSTFRGADLTEATLRKSNITEANFSAARMSRANLTRADASGTNFMGADLTGAELWKIYAARSDFRGAILRNVDFQLSPAHFDDCLLAGADLSGAVGQLMPNCRINIGSPEAPQLISGEDLLSWFRQAGARRITWFGREGQ